MIYNKPSYLKALACIDKTFKLLGVPNIGTSSRDIAKISEQLVKSHGLRSAISQLKAYYSESVRFSCGLKVVPATPIWVKREGGYPSILKPFRRTLEKGTVLERRHVLSLLRAYESITLPPVPDLTTVTQPSLGKSNFELMVKPFDLFLKDSEFSKSIKRSFEQEVSNHKAKKTGLPFHFSSKSGINGPTCSTAGIQSLGINKSMMASLKKLNSIFRAGNYINILKENQKYFKDHEDLSDCDREILTNYLGKIVFIPDKGGKTRLVAIGNYWIQDVLKQLHEVQYKVLSKLKTDGTYKQTSAFERVREASSKGPVWSYDLTAATDRFPIEPQQRVLEYLNKEVGIEWGVILNSMNFHYQGESIKYTVGQPMGLYSSWSMFTLTHHFIVQYCAWLERITPFDQYSILGDDVAIWNPRVATRYKKMMISFDIKISEFKSFEPENLVGPCVAEFAKRISNKGIEISAISPNQSTEAWNDSDVMPQFLGWLSSHGFEMGNIPASRLISLLGLKPREQSEFVCLLHIWDKLQAPVLTGVMELVPEYFKKVDKDLILTCRLTKLVKQSKELWEGLYDLSDSNRASLEKRLGGSVPDNLYFIRIMDTSIQKLMALEARMATLCKNRGVDFYFQDQIEGFDDEFEDFIEEDPEEDLDALSEIEYLPQFTFQQMMDGLTDHRSKKVKRCKYIRSLTKLARLVLKKQAVLSADHSR